MRKKIPTQNDELLAPHDRIPFVAQELKYKEFFMDFFTIDFVEFNKLTNGKKSNLEKNDSPSQRCQLPVD